MDTINEPATPDFTKLNGLVPAIIQDNTTLKVLMLGFMNEEAWRKTEESGRVTFFSRSRNRLWTKGEESGHFLEVVEILTDCDNDTLLIKVNPAGPVCHTGADTCWDEPNEESDLLFLEYLQDLVDERKKRCPKDPTRPPCSGQAPVESPRRWAKKPWKPSWVPCREMTRTSCMKAPTSFIT